MARQSIRRAVAHAGDVHDLELIWEGLLFQVAQPGIARARSPKIRTRGLWSTAMKRSVQPR